MDSPYFWSSSSSVRTGMSERRARVRNAGARPFDKMAGCRPRENSWSSRVTAVRSVSRLLSSCVSSASVAGTAALTIPSLSLRYASRCCAPSCRSRSSLRRAVSEAETIRAREAASSSLVAALAIAVATRSAKSRTPARMSWSRCAGVWLPTMSVPQCFASTTMGAQTAGVSRSSRATLLESNKGKRLPAGGVRDSSVP
ncbi:Uncharacterised protein [Mycobacteroides abscessus]|nr:Uncharacterised protein [Mycobacteroides abscessus]